VAAVIVFAGMVAIVLGMLVYSYVAPPHRAEAPASAPQWTRPRRLREAFRGWPRPVGGAYAARPGQPELRTVIPVPRLPGVPPSSPPPPPKVRRAVLSPDPLEHDLLAALRDQPADVAARMVYADWLEERGRLAQANLVRGVERREDVPSVLSDLVRFADGFDRGDDAVAVLRESDADWRAIACRERTDCTRSTCPRRWDLFVPIADSERERRCFTCTATVRYCTTGDEVRDCTARGERAVLDLAARLASSR
jgi:uncharacterized protein (TIGR02996 family)